MESRRFEKMGALAFDGVTELVEAIVGWVYLSFTDFYFNISTRESIHFLFLIFSNN